jgi:tRNA pseudouridine13 synthase
LRAEKPYVCAYAMLWPHAQVIFKYYVVTLSGMQLKTVPEDFIVVEMASHTPYPAGPYVLAELTKRGLSTERAIAEIGQYLQLPRKAFGYAGAKDARALTKQFITIRTTDVERIKNMKRNNVVLRVLGHVEGPIALGMLEGNRFEIVVRKINDERAVERNSIPNYFDEQRFSKANAEIGRFIVKGDFKAAADTVIKTDNEVGPRIKEWLEEKPNDAVSALKFVPRNTLLMYVHAYQSLLFNEVLSEYILQQDGDATIVDGPVKIAVPTKEMPEVRIPIFGFGTEHDPMFGALYEKILEREGLVPRDFVIRSLPFLTVEGDERDAFFKIRDLEIGELEDDDLHSGSEGSGASLEQGNRSSPRFKKQRLTFILPKGCYATMVIKTIYRIGRVLGERSMSETSP